MFEGFHFLFAGAMIVITIPYTRMEDSTSWYYKKNNINFLTELGYVTGLGVR